MKTVALLAAALALGGCIPGMSIDGLGLLMCPNGAICDLRIDASRVAPAPGLPLPGLPPGLPVPLPLPTVSNQFAG